MLRGELLFCERLFLSLSLWTCVGESVPSTCRCMPLPKKLCLVLLLTSLLQRHRYLKKGKYASRVGAGAPVYLAAVLEYLAGARRICLAQW